MLLLLDSGNGDPKAVLLYNYVGATKVANVTPNWTVRPNEGDQYRIVEPADAGINLAAYTNVTVQDNTIRDNNGAGLLLNLPGGNINITDNTITSNAGNNTPGGIGLDTGDGVTLSVTNNLIRNNTRSGNWGMSGLSGEYLNNSSAYIYNNTLIGNRGTSSNAQMGFRNGTTDVTVESNLIRATTNQGYICAFRASSANTLILSGNEFDGGGLVNITNNDQVHHQKQRVPQLHLLECGF
jgi:hypothetical protein